MTDLANTLGFIARHPLSRGRVAQNLARLLAWQVGSRLVPGAVAVDFVNGALLLARPGMTGATGNVYVGLHEFEDMAFVLHYLRPGDVFVDVGANIGSYTVLAAAAIGAESISFEPGPEAFLWLQRNIGLNGVGDRVEARREAVGSRNGQVSFTIGRDTTNHLVLETADGEAGRGNTQAVSMTTLDKALADRAPAMIKIDVEGFETEVLDGAAATLPNPELRCVIMELMGGGDRYGFDEHALRRRMTALGFTACDYEPFERRLSELRDAKSSGNTIFVRDMPFVRTRLTEAEPFVVRGVKIQAESSRRNASTAAGGHGAEAYTTRRRSRWGGALRGRRGRMVNWVHFPGRLVICATISSVASRMTPSTSRIARTMSPTSSWALAPAK